ncbi:hypothetical protein SmJEL517_g01216 [Synchytrium microbalum]|uniref:Uncharacterized protein n=1 Tax=Synchytrium microbalum TaxID=1806994 RepID=A0A507CG46_9FUNG|nr:uncharacterized protein SmJEL517_g01216 [Synchytrium microbalum]TPX36565.1 hypothetical protein SmJEL517_g01216 [Synchytrium microbalum]
MVADAYRRFRITEPLSTQTQTVKTSAPKKPCRPSHFLQLSRTWDMGGRNVREKILEEFLFANSNKTGPQIERDLGNGASLFLTRVTAWLRLTYLLGYDLSLQLRVISVFVGATDAPRFMAEFMEIGGVLTVLEILGLKQVSETDKADAVQVLKNIAQAGRRYKEFICESYGIRAVGECLAKARSQGLSEPTRDVLVLMGTNNPKYSSQVFKLLLSIFTTNSPNPICQQVAGMGLRQLLPSIPSFNPSIVESVLALLKHPNPTVQIEAYDILQELVKRSTLQDTLLSQLVSILKISVDPTGDDHSDDIWTREATTTGPPPQFSNSSDKSEEYAKIVLEASTAVYQQQSYVSKLLGSFAATSDALGVRMVQMQVVSGLLNTIGNVGYPKSQHFATNTLLFLTERHAIVAKTLQDCMGQNFYELLQNKPDTFYRELNKEQVRFLRRNTVKVLFADDDLIDDDEFAPSPSTSDDDEDVQIEGAVAEKRAKKKRSPMFPDTEGQSARSPSIQSITSMEELRMESATAATVVVPAERPLSVIESILGEPLEEEAQTHQTMYIPYGGTHVQNTAGASFAANPFVSSTASQTAEDRFDGEFERFKTTIAQVVKQREEFDSTAEAQLNKIKEKNAALKFVSEEEETRNA